MSRYAYLPGNPMEHAASGPSGSSPPAENMASGGEYEVSTEWAKRINGIVRGVDGAPCLVEVNERPKKAAAEKKPDPAKADKPAEKKPADPAIETT